MIAFPALQASIVMIQVVINHQVIVVKDITALRGLPIAHQLFALVVIIALQLVTVLYLAPEVHILQLVVSQMNHNVYHVHQEVIVLLRDYPMYLDHVMVVITALGVTHNLIQTCSPVTLV